jgi:hypothetical protein
MASVLAGALAGGAGLALFQAFAHTGQRLTITNDVLTQMSINATITSQTECISTATGEQNLNFQPIGTPYPSDKLRDKDSNCVRCQQVLREIYEARNRLESDAELSNSTYTRQVAADELDEIMRTGSIPENSASHSSATVGPCDLMCSDIVVSSVSQSQRFESNSTCQVNNEVTNNIQQQLQGTISSYLKNEQDIFGQLESMFTSNTESIANNISTSLTQNINEAFYQDLKQNAENSQTIAIGNSGTSPGGYDGNYAHSIFIQSASQSFNSKQVGTLDVTNSVINQLKQSTGYSISQSLLNKNDSVGDLAKDFLQVIQTFGDAVENITFMILVIIGAIMAAIIMIVATFYVFRRKQFNQIANMAGQAVKERFQARYTSSKKK